MRAAIFDTHGGPEVLRVGEMPTPEPGANEVRVRVNVAALNHLDLWARRGLPLDIPMPHIGGSDMAGRVDAVGSGVEESWLGERVVVDPSIGYDWYGAREGESLAPLKVIGEHTQGGFAEYCVVPAANLLRIPDWIGAPAAAAAALNGVTAWHGLIGRGGLAAGESVLITGASGGVATMAIQIAKAVVGARVFAVTSGERNVERARRLGADVVYDRDEVDPSPALWRETGKRGVDVVFDSVGEAMWEGNVRALAPCGRLVVYGATTGPEAGLDLRRIFWRQLSVIGTTMGPPEAFRAVMGRVFDGTLKPVISRVLPLEQIREAHELLEAGEVFGKVVIAVESDPGWES